MPTSQVQIVMPTHINSANRLFGGQLMAWIDVVASVEARRHTHTSVSTVCVDYLEFLAPAHLGDVVRLDAGVTWSGHTSLEVRVDTFVESIEGVEKRINRAFLVFVAQDREGRPVEIPPFLPRKIEEQQEWKEAEKRREHRLQARKEPKD